MTESLLPSIPAFLTLMPVLLVAGWLALDTPSAYRQHSRAMTWIAFVYTLLVGLGELAAILLVAAPVSAPGWFAYVAFLGVAAAWVGFLYASLTRVAALSGKVKRGVAHDRDVLRPLMKPIQQAFDLYENERLECERDPKRSHDQSDEAFAQAQKLYRWVRDLPQPDRRFAEASLSVPKDIKKR